MVSLPDSILTAQNIRELNAELIQELGKSYKIVNYTFGEKTRIATYLDFSEKSSDYSELISTISNNHFNENIGAFIIAGDGIYNQGKNPVNVINYSEFPVFTIGYGDTTEITDAVIENIRVNRTSFTGNRFPVEIDTRFAKLNGIPLKLSVHEGETEVASAMIIPSGNDYFNTQQFILDSKSKGLKQYRVTIQAAENERNKKNNAAVFVINVLDSKQKIMFLSDGPHPDIGAIKNTLDLQMSYDVSVITEEPYPINLQGINLLVINQLPSQNKSFSTLLEISEKNRIPILFIVGGKTYLSQFSLLSKAARIIPQAGSFEEAQAYLNNSFASFSVSEDLRKILPKFPPLQVPFGDYTADPELTPVFYQRIKNIDTNKPLISAGMINGRKTGVIFGEGLWRWRLFDYYMNQSHSNFNELINQLVQYLALRENEENFIIDFKPVYSEIDNIVMNAEIYNDNYERVKKNEVNIIIKSSNGEEIKSVFDIQGEGYRLDAGHLPVGNYRFEAVTKIGDKAYAKTGDFTVIAVNHENIVTRADHKILYRIATQSGGRFFLPKDKDELIKLLKNKDLFKSTSYFQELVHALLNLKWLFFIILILISVEWFLRKFWGLY